jgi:hypothetical protein
MNRKQRRNMKRLKLIKPIIPQRNRCDCGRKVHNHHWLCDACWGKKTQKEFQNKLQKTTKKHEVIFKKQNEN